MLDHYSGATRVHLIVGDPIAQVKSPFGVTQAFEAAGRDAICVPAHVPPAALEAWWAGARRAQNLDGLIVTVPHKFACTAFCDQLSERAAFLGAVNTVRRNAQGQWEGDMFDGLGYVRALEKNGCQPRGLRALLVGAGGAGSAIAHSLVQAGVSRMRRTVRAEESAAKAGVKMVGPLFLLFGCIMILVMGPMILQLMKAD